MPRKEPQSTSFAFRLLLLLASVRAFSGILQPPLHENRESHLLLIDSVACWIHLMERGSAIPLLLACDEDKSVVRGRWALRSFPFGHEFSCAFFLEHLDKSSASV